MIHESQKSLCQKLFLGQQYSLLVPKLMPNVIEITPYHQSYFSILIFFCLFSNSSTQWHLLKSSKYTVHRYAPLSRRWHRIFSNVALNMGITLLPTVVSSYHSSRKNDKNATVLILGFVYRFNYTDGKCIKMKNSICWHIFYTLAIFPISCEPSMQH